MNQKSPEMRGFPERPPGSGAGGQGFESLRSDHFPDNDLDDVLDALVEEAAQAPAQLENSVPSSFKSPRRRYTIDEHGMKRSLLHQMHRMDRAGLERELHRRFKGTWIGGEWFKLSEELVDFINKLSPFTVPAGPQP